MNTIFVINVIYLLVFLARPAALKHSENKSFYNLIIPKIPVNPCLKLVPISIYSWFNQKCKNKAKQSQTKPIFWTSNFNSSQKMRIFDNFMTTFLCKTKPNYVIGIQIAVEHDVPKNINYAKRTQWYVIY